MHAFFLAGKKARWAIVGLGRHEKRPQHGGRDQHDEAGDPQQCAAQVIEQKRHERTERPK